MMKFIDDELIPQARLEIQTWIHPRKKQGGYFVVTRQIFCMVNFLGAAFSGYPHSKALLDPKGKNIAETRTAEVFINSFFKPKNVYESDIVQILYDMYRHGLVHLYQPKIYKLGKRKTLKWFFYKGNSRRRWIKVDVDFGRKLTFKNVDHLKITKREKSYSYYLPINIDRLYNDFENAVIQYRDRLKKSKQLQENWRSTVNTICEPRDLVTKLKSYKI